jgi:aspartyl-tRNA(Asn)/glutamyl-tRNA(Gln) amidotransferase subunit C
MTSLGKIGRDDVVKAAKLSRLALSDEEIGRIAVDLERILGYVEQLAAVDVDGVEPMVQPFDLEGVRREDVAAPVIGQRAIAGSAGYEDGLVRVPKVID